MISISDFADSTLNGIDISKFRQANICILGGTGFVGTWLTESLNYLSVIHDIQLKLTIYTRDKSAALSKFPRATFESVTIEEFDFALGTRDLGMHDFFVNGATPTSTRPGVNSRQIFYLPTINVISSIIESARKYGNCPRVLNLSSGTVYGHQPMEMKLRPEGPAKTLEDSDDDYRASKIVSEEMLALVNDQKFLKATSPRLFTFYGPGLPINQHFAVGNFIQDGLNGAPIRVQGSPSTQRSYMFPTDLVSWLLKSIVDPKDGDFNIGSESSISMLELATLVSELTSKKGVVLLKPDTPANNYVPNTEFFRSVYQVKENTGLHEGLTKWINWILKQK
jgi:dTDP-glucose 4,6-dehydratase